MALKVNALIGITLFLVITAKAQTSETPPDQTLPPTFSQGPIQSNKESGTPPGYNPLKNCAAPENTASYQTRLEEYQSILEKEPKNPEFLYQSGVLHGRLQQWDEAQTLFLQSLTYNKDENQTPKIYRQLGDLYACQQQFGKAIDQYKQSIRSNPEDIDTKYNLALTQQLAQRQKQQEEKKNSSSQNDSQGRQGEDDTPEDQQAERRPNENNPKQQNPSGGVLPQQKEKPTTPQSEGGKAENSKDQEMGQAGYSQNDSDFSEQQEQHATERRPVDLSRQQAEQLLNSVSENRRKFIQRSLKRQPPPTLSDKTW